MPMRITPATRAIFDALAGFDAETGTYGRQLAAVAGLPTGTVYPLLDKWEREGVLTSCWEVIDPAVEGRPARRYWKFTSEGAALAAEDRAARERARAAAATPPRLVWDGP